MQFIETTHWSHSNIHLYPFNSLQQDIHSVVHILSLEKQVFGIRSELVGSSHIQQSSYFLINTLICQHKIIITMKQILKKKNYRKIKSLQQKMTFMKQDEGFHFGTLRTFPAYTCTVKHLIWSHDTNKKRAVKHPVKKHI